MSQIIISNIINTNKEVLSVKDFIENINYNHVNLYIDKFWDNIKDDKWIYIDNELILWMGYKDLRRGKESITRLLKQYFIELDDYKILNNEEFNKSEYTGMNNEKEELRGSHKKIYIIVLPQCFKELCTYIGTTKSREINK